MTDQIDPADKRLSRDAAEPTEPMEQNEPTEPMERNEPTDPMERTEPLDAMLSTDRSDAHDHREVGRRATSAEPKRGAPFSCPIGGHRGIPVP